VKDLNMKVKELIKKLETMPQNLEVGIYCEIEEGDGIATEVEIAHAHDKYSYQAKEYYCKADSIPVCHKLTEWVVIRG
jgi:hypothetical protein